MKIYLAGPMRNCPQLNHPAFNAAAAELRAAGHEVFNPAEHDVSQGIGPEDEAKAAGMIRELLGADLAWITSTAEVIVLLPGWVSSLGAMAEFHTAKALGIPTLDLDEFLDAEKYGGRVVDA